MSTLRELSGDGLPLIAHIPGQATAGTADEFVVGVAPFKGKVVRVDWIPKAAVTANATNFFTLNVRNRGQVDGTGATNVAARSYAATNSVAWVRETATLNATAANRNVAAGDVLTVEKVNTASGLAMPQGTVIVWIRPA
jgi:hypothetical protein